MLNRRQLCLLAVTLIVPIIPFTQVNGQVSQVLYATTSIAVGQHLQDSAIEQPPSLIVPLTEDEQRWLDAHPVIRLASDPDWPPMEYVDQNGEFQGIAADFVKHVEKKLNITFVRSPVKNWPDIVEDVKNRHLDVFSMAMQTPYRSSFALFTRPYVSNSMVIVTRSSVEYVNGVESLQDKLIAVEEGYAIAEILAIDYPQAQVKTYPTTADALLAVSTGDAFAVIGNIAIVSSIIQQQGYHNLRVSGETPYRYELGMGVRSDWPILADILDKALASITEQERAEIFSNWVQVETPSSWLWHWMLFGTSIATGIILVIAYWNYLLNQRVKQRTELLEYRAQHDALTELPNRNALTRHLDERMAIADRANACIAVLFIDLDDFKKVNDTLGHSVGDELLVAVAKRLTQALRRVDIISRFGGDEFIIVTGHLHDREDIKTICQHLLSAMKPAYQLGHSTININMSIGIATYPDDGKTIEDLLRNADTAMYAAKKLGGTHFHFYSSDLNLMISRRIQLEEKLMDALMKQEISLVFQPIIKLHSGMPERFEALARWHNPQLGSISPEEFIPLAEQNGFIVPLGKFILLQSLAFCSQLRTKFNFPFSVSVNVSPRQLKEPDFLTMVKNMLDHHRLPASALIIELTEGVLINQDEQTANVMNALGKMGIHLAMDDFGTGYSSLSYIRNFPFDILKIDREFIQDIATDAKSFELVESVLAMAASMRIDVITEGVEEKAHEERLLAMNCQHAQGYYYAKPMPLEQLEKWLEQRLIEHKVESK